MSLARHDGCSLTCLEYSCLRSTTHRLSGPTDGSLCFCCKWFVTVITVSAILGLIGTLTLPCSRLWMIPRPMVVALNFSGREGWLLGEGGVATCGYPCVVALCLGSGVALNLSLREGWLHLRAHIHMMAMGGSSSIVSFLFYLLPVLRGLVLEPCPSSASRFCSSWRVSSLWLLVLTTVLLLAGCWPAA